MHLFTVSKDGLREGIRFSHTFNAIIDTENKIRKTLLFNSRTLPNTYMI